jgi:hypothetical protein
LKNKKKGGGSGKNAVLFKNRGWMKNVHLGCFQLNNEAALLEAMSWQNLKYNNNIKIRCNEKYSILALFLLGLKPVTQL